MRGRERSWGECGGSGGPVAQVSGGVCGIGARTLACGNGAGNSFLTESALLDEVHSNELRCARRWHVAMARESHIPARTMKTPSLGVAERLAQVPFAWHP